MAVNILLHQADATRHNYLLYNPVGSEKFYFLPWDYDAAMGRWQEPPNSYDNDALRQRREYGYAVGSMNDFTSRYNKLPGIHERMQEAVSYIRQNYLTDAVVTEKATLFASLVAPFETQAPDNQYNPEYQETSALKFAEYLGVNEEALKSSFSIPMPPTLIQPELVDSRWVFRWDPAYDVTGNDITYDLQIASSLEFAAGDIVLTITGIEDSPNVVEHDVEASQLPAGDYFARLTARAISEPDRFWQVASNLVVTNGERHFGIMPFSVP